MVTTTIVCRLVQRYAHGLRGFRSQPEDICKGPQAPHMRGSPHREPDLIAMVGVAPANKAETRKDNGSTQAIYLKSQWPHKMTTSNKTTDT
jgi:hypothetical protein